MSDRFFSAAPITTGRAALDGTEAHHLLHVMRVSIGDHVTLFDNSGVEFTAVIEKLGRRNVHLRIVDRKQISRELPFSMTVGVALPKGDRQKWLVEKLTELGVTAVVPLETARGVAQPTHSALERLERAVIEAAKQCGRNCLMQIARPRSWEQWISQSASIAGDPRSPEPRRLLAHPGGRVLSTLDLSIARNTALTVGPEGGLTEDELAVAITAGWQNVDLGPRILRIETAAIALTAAIAYAAR
jgi:16S rRNA (uracil1498-N3)-methyltransferase